MNEKMPASEFPGGNRVGPISFRQDCLWGLALVLAVVVTYLPVWRAGFIWDDDGYVNVNASLTGPLGLSEIWSSSVADISPLAKTTFWVEHVLWGLAPLPYHLVNVILHACCAILLWRVLQSLFVPGAWLGAAMWALHPVEVESVAWVSEMKNTESGLFFLLAIFFFVRGLKQDGSGEQNRSRWSYGLMLLFAALAMASKSSTVILPVVLCLAAWWVEGRWRWINLLRVAPTFFMAAAASALSIWTEWLHLTVSVDPQWVRTGPQRLVAAGDAVWFYLGKLLWPHPLITIYSRWKIDAGSIEAYLPLLAVLIVFVLLWSQRGSWLRPWFFAYAYFLVALLPVLGLVDNTIFCYSLVFDHFQYLASMGPLALAGAGLARWAQGVNPSRFWLRSGLCTGLLLLLSTVSWQRAWVYQSAETLWSDTLTKNDQCWAAYNNLGLAISIQGRREEAMALYEKALKINPHYAEAEINLGAELFRQGRIDEAMAHELKAVAIDPNQATAYNNLGQALLRKGEVDAALAQYQKALAINPYNAEAHLNLGGVYLQKGQTDAAIEQLQAALAINPSYAGAYNNLGGVLLQKGDVDAAIAQYQTALSLDPDSVDTRYNLGYACLQKGQVDEAIDQLHKAAAAAPNRSDIHMNLGVALFQKGRVDEAITQYEAGLKISPEVFQAHSNLGKALLQKGRVDEAIAEELKALALNPNFAEAHYNLGNAYLQKRQLADAIAQYQQALVLNPASVKTHNNLGIALVQNGQTDAGMAEFQAALRLQPDYTDAQKNLALAKARTALPVAHGTP